MMRQSDSLRMYGVMSNSREAAKDPVLAMLRELVRTYQAFADLSAADIRRFGLSPAEFDVLCTLGNQPGMTLKEIGCNTLITKTTLTGVVDRLQQKGLIERRACSDDGRCIRAVLTKAGDALFQEIFPQHIEYLHRKVGALNERTRLDLDEALRELQTVLRDAH